MQNKAPESICGQKPMGTSLTTTGLCLGCFRHCSELESPYLSLALRKKRFMRLHPVSTHVGELHLRRKKEN